MARKSVEQKWRKRYSKASYRLRQQIKNLEKRYPESVALERGRLEDWEPLKSLPKDYTLKQLKMRTRLAEKVLKEGQYSLQVHRRSYAQASRTLREKGLKDIDNKKIGAFFRFLDDLSARGIAGMKSSRVWARLFSKARKKGLSGDDLARNIDYWAQQFEKNARYKPELMPSSSGSNSF